MHFRGTNAINAKITGSGIGLKLVDKLVHLHSGKINIESVEQQGTTITVVFPKGNKHFRHSNLIDPEKTGRQEAVLDAPVISEAAEKANDENLQRILIVEDNDELRAYLVNSLSPMYNVQACGNGKEALIIVKEFWPELILSDIMMPEMRVTNCVPLLRMILKHHIFLSCYLLLWVKNRIFSMVWILVLMNIL